jgi:FKBP-type peptidyl-prolyl cis-trans isomerase SlyD
MVERTPDIVVQDMVVSLEYSLTVDDQIIDSSDGYGPLQFIQGHRNIIPGLEKELFGMQIGETREVVVQPADGYGDYDASAFVDIPKEQFPANFDFGIGKTIRLSDPQGRLINANITEIGESDVKLDLNHPLAGKELYFKATVVDLRMATDDELAAGRLGGGGCASCGSGSGDGCGGGCG